MISDAAESAMMSDNSNLILIGRLASAQFCNSRVEAVASIAMSSRAKSRDLANAESVTQVGEILRLRSG